MQTKEELAEKQHIRYLRNREKTLADMRAKYVPRMKKRECEICKVVFLPTGSSAVCCSEPCRKIRNKNRSAARYLANRDEYLAGSNARYVPRVLRTERKCKICKSVFVIEGKHPGKECFCGEECRLTGRRIREKRARQTEGYKESVRKFQKSPKYKAWLRLPKNRARLRAYARNFALTHPEVRVYSAIRSSIKRRIGAGGHTSDYVFYTKVQLRNHLENLWKPGMTWANYGLHGWHVDHKKPLASFNFFLKDGSLNMEQVRRANSLANLQPLWAKENLSKGKRLDFCPVIEMVGR